MTMTTKKVLAYWRICEKCNNCFPYIDSLTEEELQIKKARLELKIEYVDLVPEGHFGGSSSDSSVDPKICAACHDDLLRDQILIVLKKERDFKTISDHEKAVMMACGEIPTDICWYCGDKIDIGPNYKRGNMYQCAKCRGI